MLSLHEAQQGSSEPHSLGVDWVKFKQEPPITHPEQPFSLSFPFWKPSPDPSPHTSLWEPLLCHPLTSSRVTNPPPRPGPRGPQNVRLSVLKPINFQDTPGQADDPPPLPGSLCLGATPSPRENALLTQSHQSTEGSSVVRRGCRVRVLSPHRWGRGGGNLVLQLLTEQQLTRTSQTLLLSTTYLGPSPAPHSAAHPPHPAPKSSFRKSVCESGAADVPGVLPALWAPGAELPTLQEYNLV